MINDDYRNRTLLFYQPQAELLPHRFENSDPAWSGRFGRRRIRTSWRGCRHHSLESPTQKEVPATLQSRAIDHRMIDVQARPLRQGHRELTIYFRGFQAASDVTRCAVMSRLAQVRRDEQIATLASRHCTEGRASSRRSLMGPGELEQYADMTSVLLAS